MISDWGIKSKKEEGFSSPLQKMRPVREVFLDDAWMEGHASEDVWKEEQWSEICQVFELATFFKFVGIKILRNI